MAALRGWGPNGERLQGFAPHGHWRTLTFLGALRAAALTAPCVFDGPINGPCFRACVEQQLVPTLQAGDSVIPRAPCARVPYGDRIDAAGIAGQSRQPQGRRRPPSDQGRRRQALVPAALLARPQSIGRSVPDPIPQGPPPLDGGGEQALAKTKHWMRAAQKRTVEDPWRHIGHLVARIEPAECANYLANAGYASIKT